MRGYNLWRDVVNAHGGLLGHPVKLKILDDTSSPTQVVSNYQNLITKDKVSVRVRSVLDAADGSGCNGRCAVGRR